VAIDIAFDFRTDANAKDPDSHSPTLRRYHLLLWSKPLPSGASFDLSETTPGVYLHHRSSLGEFFLSSDSVMQTFTRWPALKPITEQIPEQENEAFSTIAYTIGAMMVFPGNQIDRKLTINGARGFNRSVSDRFDLTLECIRRHFLNKESPLAPALSRYADSFALFGDFRGYVSFFLLDDLVTDDFGVKFFMPFDDFLPPSVPRDVGTYKEYRRGSIDFIEARNHRINSSTPEPVLEPGRPRPGRVREVPFGAHATFKSMLWPTCRNRLFSDWLVRHQLRTRTKCIGTCVRLLLESSAQQGNRAAIEFIHIMVVRLIGSGPVELSIPEGPAPRGGAGRPETFDNVEAILAAEGRG